MTSIPKVIGQIVARGRRASVVAVVGAVATVGVIAAQQTLVPPPAPLPVSSDTETSLHTPIKVVQANISKDLSTSRFRADVAEVMAESPDIITYNEVHARADADLAPAGYAIFRTPGPRTGWAPVVWKTSEWSVFDQGTVKISDTAPCCNGTWVGVRYANWVSLVNDEGQILSVISSHIAPNNKDTAVLLVPSLKRLAALTKELSTRGAVLLGGDFNMGYRSTRYQPQYLAAEGLTNTYEMLGTSFPTHRGGGTVDYLFVGPTEHFYVSEHRPVLVNSDHRLVVAQMELMSGASGSAPIVIRAGRVVSNPLGDREQRWAIRSAEARAIKAVPTGGAIHVASPRIGGTGLMRLLAKAYQRGVSVTVITAPGALSAPLADLKRVLGTKTSRPSYFAQRDAWRPSRPKLAQTVLLISRAGATPAVGFSVNATLGFESVRPSYRRKSTAVVTADTASYDRLYRGYLAVLGRTY